MTSSSAAHPRLDMPRVFKALGDPTRLAIFEAVRSGAYPAAGHSPAEIEQSVGDIARQFDVSLSTVSHHIKELRAAGLLRCERRGQSIYCSIDPAALEEVRRFLG